MTTTLQTRQSLPYKRKFDKFLLHHGKVLRMIKKDHNSKYELTVRKFLNRVIRPDWHVVDLGAGIGYRTITMAKLASKVFAFENEIEKFTELQKNIIGFSNISLLPLAFSKHARIIIRDLKGCPVDDHLVRLLNKGIKLDNQIAKCNFFKISQHSSIFAIIKGAERLIEKFHPVLFIEESPIDLEEILHILKYEGYEFFALRSSGKLRKIEGSPKNSVVAIYTNE